MLSCMTCHLCLRGSTEIWCFPFQIYNPEFPQRGCYVGSKKTPADLSELAHISEPDIIKISENSVKQQVIDSSFPRLTLYQSFGSFDINPQTLPELSPWPLFTSFIIVFPHHLFPRSTSNALLMDYINYRFGFSLFIFLEKK